MDLKEITKSIYITPYDPVNNIPTIGYINGSKFSIMVDFGNSKNTIDTFETLIKKNNLKSPKLTVLTHSNISTIECLKHLKSKTVSCLSTHKKIKEIIKRNNLSDSDEKCCIHPNISFSGKIIIKLGNLTCSIVEIPSPYCDDCVAVFVKEEKTLFLADNAADNILSDMFFNVEKAEKLVKILSILDFNKCILGHFNKIMTKKEILDFLKREIDKNTKKMA